MLEVMKGDGNLERTDQRLRTIKGFIEEKLSNGGAELTLDEALVHWELENQSCEEREETLRAIGKGLADLEAGRMRPFEEFDREFREARPPVSAMSYRIQPSAQAEEDIERIFDWLSKRSPDGAARWYESFWDGTPKTMHFNSEVRVT